jgi:CBS domain-containing protein
MKHIHDVMQPAVETIEGHELLTAAARCLCEHDLRLLVVISDEGHAIGTVTDRDIVRLVASGQDPTRERVADACSTDLLVVAPDDGLEAAAKLMGEHGVRRLPVCEDGRLVGIVALDDLAPEHLSTEGILRGIFLHEDGPAEHGPRMSEHLHLRDHLHRRAG